MNPVLRIHFASALAAFGFLLGLLAPAAATEPLSHEFKLPLQTDRFAKNEQAAAKAYAESFAALLRQTHLAQVRPRARLEHEREVRFLDTPRDCALRSAGFILRARTEGPSLQLTLKTRSSDEAWVRATRLDAPGATSKLEEDVEAPAQRRLSRSVSLKLPGEASPSTLAQAALGFPALAGLARDDAPLGLVGGAAVSETVYKLPSWKSAGTRFEASLTIWRSVQDGKLLFVESDFGYTAPADPARAQAAATQARALFAAMQSDRGWAAARAQTKTDFVYTTLGGDYCRR
jgi:hypothetical protein